MADEINPITGKPYSKNPRAQSARRKRNRRKSKDANEAENERVLQRERDEWEAEQERKENEAIDVEDLKQQEDMKQGNYLESKKMDEIYAKDKAANSEFDRLVEEARGLTGRAKAAKLKQAGRIREGNTGISISEVPGAAWGVAESYAQSMMEDPAAISEHFTDMWLDTKAFGAGAAKGAMAGALVDGPLPFGETAGALIGGTAAVATRRFGKKALKEFFDWSLDSGRRLIYGDEVVDAATGMPMRIDNADDFTSAKPSQITGVQGELPIQRFQNIPYQQRVTAKMNEYGMKGGVMDINALNSVKLGSNPLGKQRSLIQDYLSPSEIAGSFTGFGKANRPGFAEKWADFLKAKGLDPVGDVQIHHINPLYDSIQLFDGVKFNSKEYWDVIETLIQGNARTGVIHRGEDVNNLMMTLGKAKNVNTPHGIAHKYLNEITPTFFSKAEIKLMKKDPTYRIQKANEWAEIVVKSEQTILEGHKQWSLLNPKIAKKLSFDELVENLSKYTDQGYSKLLSPEYQLPDFNRIITQIANDKGLKGPIFQVKPKPRNLVKEQKDADLIKEGLDIQDAALRDRNLRKMRNPKPDQNPGQGDLFNK